MDKQAAEVKGFGKRLAAYRKFAKLTQEEHARIVGVSRRVIAYYEGETERPPTIILPIHGASILLKPDHIGLRLCARRSIRMTSVFWREIHARL